MPRNPELRAGIPLGCSRQQTEIVGHEQEFLPPRALVDPEAKSAPARILQTRAATPQLQRSDMFIETPSRNDSLELRRSGMSREGRYQPDHVAPTELCSAGASVALNMPLLRSVRGLRPDRHQRPLLGGWSFKPHPTNGPTEMHATSDWFERN